MVLCLQDIDELLRAYERDGAGEGLAAYVANPQMPAEGRLRAAMTLSRARDARTPTTAAIDQLLFDVGNEDSARQLGERVRAGTDRDERLREIEHLGKLKTPSSRTALLAVAGDDAVDAELRLAAADAARASGSDPRDVLRALTQIHSVGRTVGKVEPAAASAPRADTLAVAMPPAKRAAPRPAEPDSPDVSRARLNLILAAAAVGLAVLLLVTRRRA